MTLLKAAVSHAHPPKRKVDLVDRRILYELEQNCRRSLSDIARKVRVSKQTLHYRIERLVREGIITHFVALLDTSKLGLINHEVWIQLAQIPEENKKSFIDFLIAHKNTRWVAECGGKADLVIAIAAPNVVRFNQIWQDILSKYGNYVKNYFLTVSSEYFTYPRKHLVGLNENKTVSYLGGEPKPSELDLTDIKILKILSKDARAQIIYIAKAANVTENTIRSKIKRMEKERIIQTYSAIIQPAKLDLIHFEILAITQNMSEEKEKELQTYCLLNPYTTYYLRLIGRYDIDIAFDALNQEHFQQLIVEFRSRFPDIIKDFDFFYILHVHKFDYFAGFTSQI